MPKVFIAADHAGFALKNALLERVRGQGHKVEDLGAFTFDAEDDYPDIMTPLAHKVFEEEAFGIMIGGSGQGEAMCANRVTGVRAAVFYGPVRASAEIEREGGVSEDAFDIVRLARRHNGANVLSIGARFVSENDAAEAVRIFLETPFSDVPRHSRRLAKF